MVAYGIVDHSTISETTKCTYSMHVYVDVAWESCRYQTSTTLPKIFDLVIAILALYIVELKPWNCEIATLSSCFGHTYQAYYSCPCYN